MTLKDEPPKKSRMAALLNEPLFCTKCGTGKKDPEALTIIPALVDDCFNEVHGKHIFNRSVENEDGRCNWQEILLDDSWMFTLVFCTGCQNTWVASWKFSTRISEAD